MTTTWLYPVDIDMDGFAERLRLLRTERGLTQTRLAELLGMPARSYNRWERGGHVPHLEMAVRIADILQVSLDELVGRKDASSPVAIRNHELHQLVQQVDALPDQDQQALITVMDGLVKKSQFVQVLHSRTVRRPRATVTR
ncbi:MAG: helix-turn-helix domain-containing protein [Lysobacter sp.]